MYIYNKHIAPVTVNARDGKGVVLFTKRFEPERTDAMTGRVVSTGYTAITDEEYRQLAGSSRTFVHYKDGLKLLAASDDAPPEAKTPQEALVDAKRKGREAEGRITALEAENRKLKADLAGADKKIGQLVSASTSEEALKPFKDRIASLEEAAKELDALRKENEALKQGGGAPKTGGGGKGKEFD
jgi:hypothetical protein